MAKHRSVLCARYLRGESGELLEEPGWCVAKEQPPRGQRLTQQIYDDFAWGSVPTLCGYHVVLPVGVACRRPTCPECKRILTDKAKYPQKTRAHLA